MGDSIARSVGSIAQALAKAQLEIGSAHKDSSNPYFKSKYADLNSVLDACKEPLAKNDIAIIQTIGKDDKGDYLNTILAHKSGETIESKMYLILAKKDMQGYGSAVTYARRYALQAIAGVGADDDDGNACSQQDTHSKRKKKEPKKISLEEIAVRDVTNLAAKAIAASSKDEVLRFLSIESSKDLEKWLLPDLNEALDALGEKYGVSL